MEITLTTPDVDQLVDVLDALRGWQHDDSPLQLHPGDLGWNYRFGAAETAAAIRTWSRDGQLLAVGFLDAPDLLRMTVAPAVSQDREVVAQVVTDLFDPGRGVLPAGTASVEAPNGSLVHHLLDEAGWSSGEPWTPLRRDLTEAVPQTALRVEVVGPAQAGEYAAVLRSAFGSARFTEQRWLAMAAGPAYADARSLLGRDERGTAVAHVTVWSAGPGRPGLIEPLGVHAEHRGRGYGRAICLAALEQLTGLGSTSAWVCTPSALTGAVATYEAAGLIRLPERLDRTRENAVVANP